jgi:hypothetical protein
MNRDECHSRRVGIVIVNSSLYRGNKFRDECLVKRQCNVIIVTWLQKP